MGYRGCINQGPLSGGTETIKSLSLKIGSITTHTLHSARDFAFGKLILPGHSWIGIMRLAIAPGSTVRSRFKVLDYFIISSEKFKCGWTLTTSQYTITHSVYFKTQRTVFENTKLIVQHYRHTTKSASSWALTCNYLIKWMSTKT